MKKLFLLHLIVPVCMHAAGGPAIPGEMLWQIAARIEESTCIIESKVCAIESIVDITDECAATPITDDGFTITLPGTYCLANDINGPLTIAANQVVLDLNGHSIIGALGIIAATRNEIIIKNGFIQSAAGVGISLSDCTNIELHNLIIRGALTGMALNSCQIGSIADCIISNGVGGALVALALVQSSCLTCKNIEICRNAGVTVTGVDIQGGRNICCTDLKVYQNTASNIVVAFQANLASNIIYEKCSALQNITTVNDLNTACIGFNIINVSSNVCILFSLIKDNATQPAGTTTGILLDDTVLRTTVRNNIVKDNNNNGVSIGINNTGSTNVVLANEVQNHAVNFAGTAVPLTVFTAATGIFAPAPEPYDNISVI